MAGKAKSADGTVKLKAVQTTPLASPVVKTDAPTTKIVGGAVAVAAGNTLKKQDFIDRAVNRTEVKKRDAKPAIEAALAVLADALLAGEELVLPPMGKLRVVKSKDVGDGAKVLTLKLRTMKDGAGQGGGGNSKSGETGDNDDD